MHCGKNEKKILKKNKSRWANWDR